MPQLALFREHFAYSGSERQPLQERAEIKTSTALFAFSAQDYRVASPNPQNFKLHGAALLETR